jgi:hypothetical protein
MEWNGDEVCATNTYLSIINMHILLISFQISLEPSSLWCGFQTFPEGRFPLSFADYPRSILDYPTDFCLRYLSPAEPPPSCSISTTWPGNGVPYVYKLCSWFPIHFSTCMCKISRNKTTKLTLCLVLVYTSRIYFVINSIMSHEKKRLVILGGGLAGLPLARQIEKNKKLSASLDVTLVDKKHYFELTLAAPRFLVDSQQHGKVCNLFSSL